jgi:hypothetical protein
MTDPRLPFFLPVNRGSGGEALCAFRAVNAPRSTLTCSSLPVIPRDVECTGHRSRRRK